MVLLILNVDVEIGSNFKSKWNSWWYIRLRKYLKLIEVKYISIQQLVFYLFIKFKKKASFYKINIRLSLKRISRFSKQ